MRLDHWSTSALQTYQQCSSLIILQQNASEHSLLSMVNNHKLMPSSTITYILTAIIQMNVGYLVWVSSSTCSVSEPSGISGTRFYGPLKGTQSAIPPGNITHWALSFFIHQTPQRRDVAPSMPALQCPMPVPILY